MWKQQVETDIFGKKTGESWILENQTFKLVLHQKWNGFSVVTDLPGFSLKLIVGGDIEHAQKRVQQAVKVWANEVFKAVNF